MYPLLILMEGHMRKFPLAIAAALLAASLPAWAQENESREHSAMAATAGICIAGGVGLAEADRCAAFAGSGMDSRGRGSAGNPRL